MNKLLAFLIFDNNTYELENSSSYKEVYAPVFEMNRKLINGLLQMYSTPVYIYFQVDPSFHLPETAWFDKGAGIYFVPVNAACYDPDGFVPTKWVQDVFIQPEPGVLFYQPEFMNRGLLMALHDTLGGKVLIKAGEKGQPEGGNVHYFVIGEQQFIISGKVPDSIPSGHSSNKPPLGFPPAGNAPRYINCSVKSLPATERLFFHLDMYLQWIGMRQISETSKTTAPGTLALKGIAFSNQNLTAEELHYITSLPDEAFTRLKTSIANLAELEAIPVPMLLFPDKSNQGNSLYAMTYVNAIIENVELKNGLRQVTIYFPDFSEEIGELLRGVRLDNKMLTDINDAPPVIYTLVNAMSYVISVDRAVPGKEDDFMNKKAVFMLELYNKYFSDDPYYGLYVFIQEMHNYLIKQFINYKEVRVCFVRNNFANYAEHYGGLHCLVKPIYG